MPFLFPALVAAACDLGILYLSHRNYLLQQLYAGDNGIGVNIGVDDDNTTTTVDNNWSAFNDTNANNDDAFSDRRVYHYGYITILATIRLFLLFVPLPYHSYHGKALRCPILYKLLYGGTLVAVSIHALALIMVDPESLLSLVEAVGAYSNGKDADIYHILVTRSLWVAILLTIFSTLGHVALFFHVRSTAPADTEFFGGRQRPKVLLYYAKEKEQHQNLTINKYISQENTEREGLLSGSTGCDNGRDIGGGGSSRESNKPIIIGPSVSERRHEELESDNSSNHSSSNRAFQEMSNKLMTEIQIHLRKAKREWTKRLEEYQKPMMKAATSSKNGANVNDGNLSPFRVVLELFAGDNSNNNNYVIDRLDAVYDRDDGAALLSFVPQLLSFLLHGAYESSHYLEAWILETCRKNLFFSHKCYFFLRAWSLESSVIRSAGNTVSGSVFVGGSYTWKGGINKSRLSHSSSLASFDTQDVQTDNNLVSKLLPEERTVIEELMRKIMKCGEEQARLLHFGTIDKKLESFTNCSADDIFLNDSVESNKNNNSTENDAKNFEGCRSLSIKNAVAMGHIPVDLNSGIPSKRHYECLVAKRRYGFLPLDNGAVVNSYKQSILSGDNRAISYFDSTPVFMDALVIIADGLFKVPRDLRTKELKRQLNLLELEALPCNEIYIPLQNLHHRVWRIVSDESIAISTKERVPCIVCLEVVDYSQEPHHTNQNDNGGTSCHNRDIRKLLKQRTESGLLGTGVTLSERDMVEAWKSSPRDPHRRESAFGRLTHGMGKIPDKMKSTMQEQINRLKHIRLETDMNDFWSVHVPDTLTFDTDDSNDNCNGNSNDNDNLSGNDINIISNKMNRCDDPVLSNKDIERGDYKSSNGGEVKSIDNRPFQISQPPASPQSPRTSISLSHGAMGQWTKSPGPKKSAAIIQHLSDAAVEELAAPTMKRRSYNSVNNNNSRRRLSNGVDEYGCSASRMSTHLDATMQFENRDLSDEEDNGRNLNNSYAQSLSKPLTKPPPVVFKENWREKEDRLRSSSAYGNHPGWKLLPVLIKSNDDLRQEQLASQLIYRMALILSRERIPVWLCPNEILALEACGGIIEAIPDTISIASLKKNDPDYTDLKNFFDSYFDDTDCRADAKANFCESLAAYSIVCFLLQIKDRHNGNILLDNRGHLIHIDFGFFFLSSPGKNTGFESAPFKLTREWVDVLSGADSHLFGVFRTLCYRTFIALRKNCHEIILLVEMLQLGNEDLTCFRGRPDDAIRELRQRFRLDLNDRACLEYVNALIDESLENWRTNWYDRYQRYCVGVL